MSRSDTPADVGEHLPLTPLSFDVLLSLGDGPRHGYGMIKEIEGRTGEPLASSTGTFYLALKRLLKEGLIEVVEATGKGARGRSYALTELGRAVAVAEADRLASLVGDAHRKKLLSDAALAAALDGRAGGEG
ncbi:MAG: PadR family transcriptional regulator [Acidobacteriota bacterium]